MRCPAKTWGLEGMLCLLMLSGALPARAQTLHVCNRGTVTVEVVVATRKDVLLPGTGYWMIEGIPVAPGACEQPYQVGVTGGGQWAYPAYIGFGFADSQGQWGAATMDRVPDLGESKSGLISHAILSKGEKTLCVRQDKTSYQIKRDPLPQLNCATLPTQLIGPDNVGHGSYVPLAAVLYFQPEIAVRVPDPPFFSTSHWERGEYYLYIAPSATGRELHASVGGPDGTKGGLGANPPQSETVKARLVPAGFDNKEKYGIYLYGRMGHLSDAEANSIYAGMVTALGKDIVEAAAEKVRTAEKTPNEDLVTHVKEPYKVGPGGSRVEDYDAPFPPGVIGVYRSQLVAMEVLATEDSDAHYLLYLLKGRFQENRRFLPKDADKWTYAKNAYEGLKRAFGQEQVHAAGRAVHAATKRLLTGSIMNQQSLGATRNEPFEAFEDILARKDLRGYVRAAIAFKENLFAPAAVDVDAAYQKLIAGSNEDNVLEAARKMVAGKPHFLYKDELDYLKRVIDGR